MFHRSSGRTLLISNVLMLSLMFVLLLTMTGRDTVSAQSAQPAVAGTSQGSKPLVLYYSLTGKNKIIAEELKKQFSCDMGEIKLASERSGIWGFIVSGYENIFDKDAELQPFAMDLASYNPIIICSPIWMQKISSPARTFLKNPQLKGKEVYLFVTYAGRWGEDKEQEVKKELPERGIKLQGIYRIVLGKKTEDEIRKEVAKQLEKKPILKKEAKTP
jgi:flavodoxin